MYSSVLVTYKSLLGDRQGRSPSSPFLHQASVTFSSGQQHSVSFQSKHREQGVGRGFAQHNLSSSFSSLASFCPQLQLPKGWEIGVGLGQCRDRQTKRGSCTQELPVAHVPHRVWSVHALCMHTRECVCWMHECAIVCTCMCVCMVPV